jgi:hypothetical protein
MKRKPIYGFLVIPALMFACSIDTTTPEKRATFGLRVTYITGGGLSPVLTEMTVDPSGEATARRINRVHDSVLREGERLLSNAEMSRLRVLLEPFADFERHYEPDNPMTDGPSDYIEVDRSGDVDKVSVYPAGYTEIPTELKNLIGELNRVKNDILK